MAIQHNKMGFEIKHSIFNLGETKIDNIFIEEYMPHAPAEYVKIYIIALSKAQSARESLHIMDVARTLETSLLKVLEAFEYWREKNLVEIIEDIGIEKKNIKRCEEIKNHEKVKIIFKNIKDIHILSKIQTPSFEPQSRSEHRYEGSEHKQPENPAPEYQMLEQRALEHQGFEHQEPELNYEGLTKILSGENAGNEGSFTRFIEKLEYIGAYLRS